MVDKQMGIESQRVAKLGRGLGVVGRGCTPGGIGVDKTARQPCKAGLQPIQRPKIGKNGPKRRVWGSKSENRPENRVFG